MGFIGLKNVDSAGKDWNLTTEELSFRLWMLYIEISFPKSGIKKILA